MPGHILMYNSKKILINKNRTVWQLDPQWETCFGSIVSAPMVSFGSLEYPYFSQGNTNLN